MHDGSTVEEKLLEENNNEIDNAPPQVDGPEQRQPIFSYSRFAWAFLSLLTFGVSITTFNNHYHERRQNSDLGFGTFMLSITVVIVSRLIAPRYPRLANTLTIAGGIGLITSAITLWTREPSNSVRSSSESPSLSL